MSVPIKTSSVEKIGVLKLRNTILSRLFGKPISIDILPPTENNHESQSAIIANLYDLGHIIKETKIHTLDIIRITLWVDDALLNRYLSKINNQLIISENTTEVSV